MAARQRTTALVVLTLTRTLLASTMTTTTMTKSLRMTRTAAPFGFSLRTSKILSKTMMLMMKTLALLPP